MRRANVPCLVALASFHCGVAERFKHVGQLKHIALYVKDVVVEMFCTGAPYKLCTCGHTPPSNIPVDRSGGTRLCETVGVFLQSSFIIHNVVYYPYRHRVDTFAQKELKLCIVVLLDVRH